MLRRSVQSAAMDGIRFSLRSAPRSVVRTFQICIERASKSGSVDGSRFDTNMSSCYGFWKFDPVADWDSDKDLGNVEGASKMHGSSFLDVGSDRACPVEIVMSAPFSAFEASRCNVGGRHEIRTTRDCLGVSGVPLGRSQREAQQSRRRQISQAFDGKGDVSL